MSASLNEMRLDNRTVDDRQFMARNLRLRGATEPERE
jgi:hypothetical protein